MENTVWAAAEEYWNARVLGSDPEQEATLAANAAAGLPHIDVPAGMGKLLSMMLSTVGAKGYDGFLVALVR